MLELSLHPDAQGARRVYARELSGRDELLLEADRPWSVTTLLARLLIDEPGGAVHPDAVWSMSLADRDRAVAELYRHCFGERVQSVCRCQACNKGFELSFSVPEMIRSVEEQVVRAIGRLEGGEAPGQFRDATGLSFRVPTPEDERSAAGHPAPVASVLLLERCLLAGEGEVAQLAVERHLQEVAPLMRFLIAARCAECGLEQHVTFDMVRFFLALIQRERPILLREIHTLASAYGWSRDEILDLPRRERQAYVGMIVPVAFGGFA